MKKLLSLLALAACSHWMTPRFGDLKADERQFEFQHDIQLFQAKNGLRIAILPDHRSNLVTVDMRYLVGAGDDPDGARGMAHLVEHTTFLARAQADGSTISDRLGEATLSFNAWTSADETEYESTALATRLGDVLDLEAARMSETCDQIDDALFSRERDVVMQEEAQRSDPLDDVRNEIAATVWGGGHPYARGVGSAQVATSARQDACDFYAKHYAPGRAILVVTGDVDVGAASSAIAARFGPIANHDLAERANFDPADLDGQTSQHTAAVDHATAMIFFRAPPLDSDELGAFDLARTYLAQDLAALDDATPWIIDTDVSITGGKIARVLTVSVVVSDPARLDDAVAKVYDVAARLADPKQYDSMRWTIAQAELRESMMRQWDSFLSRGAWIADFVAYTQDNRFFLTEMGQVAGTAPDAIGAWAGENLTREKSHVALVRPSGKSSDDDRITLAAAGEHAIEPWRAPVDPSEASQPLHVDQQPTASTVSKTTLDNGLIVVLAPDPQSPMVDARLVFEAGSAADPSTMPGLAFATAQILGPDYDATFEHQADLAKVVWAYQLGTLVDADVDETATVFRARGLALYADWHVWRLFFTLDQGTFTKGAIDAFRQRVADAGDTQTDPGVAAMRALLFGKDHPYAAPALTVAQLKNIGKKEMEQFRRDHYRANGATLVISGGFDRDAMLAEVKQLFGAWSNAPAGEVPPIPQANPATGPSWLAVLDDDAPQVATTIAFATQSDARDDRAARDVLEGVIEDRMRVVREGLGASYGVEAAYESGAGGGILAVSGDLDPAHAGDALKAMLDELATLRDPKTDLSADFVRARRKAFAAALAQVAGASAVAGHLTFLAIHYLSSDYFATLPDRIGAVTLEDLRALIARDLDEHRMVVSVRGHRDAVKAALATAGAPAQVTEIDAR